MAASIDRRLPGVHCRYGGSQGGRGSRLFHLVTGLVTGLLLEAARIVANPQSRKKNATVSTLVPKSMATCEKSSVRNTLTSFRPPTVT